MSGTADVNARVQGDVTHLNAIQDGKETDPDKHESVASVAQREINDARHSLDPSQYADYIRGMQGQLKGYNLAEVNFYNSESANPIAKPQNGGKDDLYPKMDDATLALLKDWKSPDKSSEIKTFDDDSSRGLHYDSNGKLDAINETDKNGYSIKERKMADGTWVKGPVSKQWDVAVDPLTLVKPKDPCDPAAGQPPTDAPGAVGQPPTDAPGAVGQPPTDAPGAVGQPPTDAIDPSTGVVQIDAPDDHYTNSNVGSLVKNPEQVFQGASDNDNDRYQRAVKGTNEVVNPDNPNEITSYNAGGFTLSKHDDGDWYVHNDNGGKFVKVRANSITQDDNGTVKYNVLGFDSGEHTLGKTDSSIFGSIFGS
jgi:hypothetical protein